MITIDRITDVENYIEGIDAVVFDLDDTLYSEKEYVRSGYRKIAAQFRLPQLEEELWAVFLRGGKAIDEVFQAHDMLCEKEQALHTYRVQEPDIHFYEGVPEMLGRIHQSCRIGLITDGRPEGQRAKIRALGLDACMDEIIITDELGGVEYRKPNKRAFILMKNRMEVPFDRMVYVGDNRRKDFQAASELGMKSIWFYNHDGIYLNSK